MKTVRGWGSAASGGHAVGSECNRSGELSWSDSGGLPVKLAAGSAALLAAAGICLSAPVRAADADSISAWSGKWQPYIETEGKLGSKRSLGEVNLFIPISQNDDTLLFSDLRLRADDASSHEGNFGFGLRQMLGGGWNLGGYGYFDRRRSPTGQTYSQFTFGGELLGRDFDLRANTYWPVGTRQNVVGDTYNTTASLNGTQLQMVTQGVLTVERAIGGFDAELGWRVPVFDVESGYDLRVYAGGYRFDGKGVDAVYGPRLRAELVSFDTPGLWEGAWVTLGAEWQHDDARGSQSFASLRLRIPLQLGSPGPRRPANLQEQRMTAPIVRDIDIVTGQQVTQLPTIVESASVVGGNGVVNTVVQLDAGAVADLPAELVAAGDNSLVILNGTASVTTSSVTLQDGQTLAGGGAQLTLQGVGSGRTATLTLPGASGKIDFPTGWALVAGNNSTIAGLTINRVGATAGFGAISVNGVSNVAILNNTLTNHVTDINGSVGIRVDGPAQNIRIIGNTINAITEAGGSASGGIYTQPGTGAKSIIAANNSIVIDSFGEPAYSVWADADATFDTARSTGNTSNAADGCFFGGGTGTIEVNGAPC